MKILLTGASGFIGRHVLKELCRTPHDIVATSLEPSIPLPSGSQRVRYIPVDLNDASIDFYRLFDSPDMMIHLAWEGLPNYSNLIHFEKTLFTSYSFIKSMISGGLEDLTAIGTCFEYGLQDGCLSEDLCTNPSNPYGLSKDCLRKFIEELRKKNCFTFKWVRLFYLYGEGQSKNSILEQLKTALDNNERVFNMSSGEQLRDYLPVETAAEYLVKISLQKEQTGIINCCSGIPISIRGLVESYLKENNRSISLNLGFHPYSPLEPRAFWGDTTKLTKALSQQK